jgi:prepilin-type processing-associated H-X9-DG protein
MVAVVALLAFMAPPALAAPRHTLPVGPTRALHTPSAAAAVAKDGDRIAIDPGTYDDCAVWRQNRLLIEGVGGQPRIQGKVCQDQALWLIRGNRIEIANVAFADAHASPNNGAGIKFTGRDLTVRNSLFIHNENGILVGPEPKSHIRVADSMFRDNGKCAPVCAHGIYIGHVASATVTNSRFERQMAGHHIKSRALATELVGNRIEDGLDGTASFSVDLPNGGTAIIRGNYFQKGPKSQNRLTFISIGEEGATNPSRGIAIVQNSFLCNEPHLDSFVWNRTKLRSVLLKANSFVGSKALRLKGPGRVER